jgi:RNA polymerase sigma-70 factor (ECF subfamily)
MLIGQTSRLVSLLPASPVAASSGAKSVQRSQVELEKFIREHHAFVWRCTRRLGVHVDDVDDVVQEIFIGVAARIDSIEHPRAFLFRACTFAASHARRSAARRREVSDEERIAHAVDSAEDPERSAERGREREELQLIIDAMPDDLRDVFVLFELECLTMIEIAEIADLPPGTVASRLRRAREFFERQAVLRGKVASR